MRSSYLRLSSFVCLASTTLALPQDSRIGPYRPGRGNTDDRAQNTPARSGNNKQCSLPKISSRAEEIIQVFQFAWEGYYNNAFPNDQLAPATSDAINNRNGWGVTAVDALSTAIIMGLQTPVNQMLDHITGTDYYAGTKNNSGIDFTVAAGDIPVDVFETTIRYLGGIISAYDLLTKSSYSCLLKDGRVAQPLLDKAEVLTEQLSVAFNTKTGIPASTVFFANRSIDDEKVVTIANAGSLVLEWTRLSDLTGKKKYGDLVQKAENALLKDVTPPEDEPFPGLVGYNISRRTGQYQNAIGGWIGGSDSFYEYLIKMSIYDGDRFALYKDRWVKAVASSIKYLASSPPKKKDLTFLSYHSGTKLVDITTHLSCFDGGNFMLGGQALGEQNYIEFGKKLVSSCRQTYASNSVTGIGPEVFGWNASTVPQGLDSFYNENGWYQLNGVYDLRPEVIESYYHAYQVTEDSMYQDWAWEAFQSINETCRIGSGYSGIKDVTKKDGGGSLNNQESFFFAELLKYSFLTFAPDRLDVAPGGKNQWVFNTEGHPIKVSGKGK